jgi:orotate phosphoribosyltransferase
MKQELFEFCRDIIDAGGLEIRDVDSGEEPFVYSSGNKGPGYVMIKGLVGQPAIMKSLTRNLAQKLSENANFDFIAGNATGGMVPGWQLRNDLSDLIGKEIPYVYVRETRKIGGHKEHITGDRKNPLIKEGMRGLVFEELVNFAETTCNSAVLLREKGYVADSAGTILFYDNPKAKELLQETEVSLRYLVTLPQLLEAAEIMGKFDPKAINSYGIFLKDPIKWQLDRGYELPKK